MHRTTVRRKLERMAADGMVVLAAALVCLPPALAGRVGVQADEDVLARVAQVRGTTERGEQRRQAHARQRGGAYRILRDLRAQRRAAEQEPGQRRSDACWRTGSYQLGGRQHRAAQPFLCSVPSEPGSTGQ